MTGVPGKILSSNLPGVVPTPPASANPAAAPTFPPPGSSQVADGRGHTYWGSTAKAPWLGLVENSLSGYGTLDYWAQQGVSCDRFEVTNGDEDQDPATLATTSIEAGMTPVIVIEPSNTPSPLPTTQAEIDAYVAYALAVIATVEARFPGREVLYELINEPWFYTDATAAQYAAIVVAVLAAAGQARDRIYAMCQNATWLAAMYAAQPSLETDVPGWSFHPYGPPPPNGLNDGEGLGWLIGFRQQLLSGADNILISECGFWDPDAFGPGNPGSPGLTPSHATSSAEAQSWLTRLLAGLRDCHTAGWLKAAVIYSRNDSGWAMQSPGGALTPQGATLASWPAAQDPATIGVPAPADDGCFAWTCDPAMCANGGVAPTAGVIYLQRIRVDSEHYANHLILNVATAGAGLVNCYAGVYDINGNQRPISGDISAQLESVGPKLIALGANLQPGTYWVAILCNGTTPPVFEGLTASQIATANSLGQLGAVTRRFLQSGAGQTALPDTIDYATAQAPTTAVAPWSTLTNG